MKPTKNHNKEANVLVNANNKGKDKVNNRVAGNRADSVRADNLAGKTGNATVAKGKAVSKEANSLDNSRVIRNRGKALAISSSGPTHKS